MQIVQKDIHIYFAVAGTFKIKFIVRWQYFIFSYTNFKHKKINK